MPDENVIPNPVPVPPIPVVNPTPVPPTPKKSNMMLWLIVLVILLIALGVGGYFLLAGKSNTQQNSTVISVSPTTSPTPLVTASATVSPTSATLSKDCGAVTTHINTTSALNADANQIVDCFWNGYMNNTQVSLTLSAMGVDTGSTTYFNIMIVNGKPQISGYTQTVMVPASSGNKELFNCEKLTKDSAGLHAIGCGFKSGTQDILIPLYKKI